MTPVLLAASLVFGGLAMPVVSGSTTALVAGCPARVVALGANTSPGGRFEVERVLRVGAHTARIIETVPAELAQAHGLVPPALIGDLAVSSALFHPLPPGAGLTVTVNTAITPATARTYANALLTAGLANAEVGIAAPSSQPALGTTALLGLFAAARRACVTVDPSRQDMAVRGFVLTMQLVGALGRNAAPALVWALESDTAHAPRPSSTALAALLARDSAARGLVVPPAIRPSLVAFLRDLAGDGIAARLAAAGELVVSPTPWRARATGESHPALPRSAPPAARPAAFRLKGVWRGRVVEAGASQVTARLRGGVRLFQPAPALAVYRNGARTTLASLRAGDAITIATGASGLALLVEAVGVPQGASAVPSRSLAAAAFAGLAGLVLLALVLVPALVARARWRNGTPLAPASALVGAGRRVTYTPIRSRRAPIRRKGRA